jgi:hypothetical protein
MVRPNGLVRQSVDQKLDAVLRAYGTANCRQNRRQNSSVRNPSPTDEPKRESDGTIGVSTYVIHAVASSFCSQQTASVAKKKTNAPRLIKK